jgi:hypothetical protein
LPEDGIVDLEAGLSDKNLEECQVLVLTLATVLTGREPRTILPM